MLGAEQGTQGLRDGAGQEAVRARELFVQVVLSPLGRLLLLTLGTVAVAPGMRDAVVPPTAGTRRKTVTVMATAARLDGAADRAVDERQMGGALQGLGRQSRAERTESGQGRSPCMRVVRRVEASSCPW